MSKKQKNICSAALALVIVVFILCSYYMTDRTSMVRTVLQLGAIYALAACSMNLLNGVTGLFSLGQAGFMAVGAYVFAVFTIPVSKKAGVYYLYGVADWLKNIELSPFIAMIIGGLVAAFLAYLIGIPVLRLKSDYFAIATLGFAEIVRILVASSLFNKVTNGSLGLNSVPKFTSVLGLPSYFTPFIIVAICIAVMMLVVRSSYGRAFKAIREDEIAAEAMGINLAKHKRLSFVISSFFAGISGALLVQYLGATTPTTFPLAMTYNILLIVVIGGMGSMTGSIISAFLVTAAKEWWLRFLDVEHFIGGFQIPFMRTGFRMVVFSIILMVVVLFWRRGIMGNKEFSWDGVYNFFTRKKTSTSSGAGAPPSPQGEGMTAEGGAAHE